MKTHRHDPEGLTETIARVLAVELRTSEQRVRRALSLKDELGLDSIAAANATFALEDEFSVELEIAEGDKFDTLEDMAELLRRALLSRPAKRS